MSVSDVLVIWDVESLTDLQHLDLLGLMNDFASPRDIEASLKIHLMGQDVATPFVNVHQMPR